MTTRITRRAVQDRPPSGLPCVTTPSVLTRAVGLAAVPILLFSLVPAPSAEGPEYPIAFTDVTKEAGLLEPLAGILGHGGAWGDFDNDGKIDLYVGGFCDRPNAEYKPAAGPVHNRLFRNLGNGKFEQVKQPAVEMFGRTSGALFADWHNSGWLDLYVANNTPAKAGKKADEPQKSAQLLHCKLLRNDKGKFSDVSDASGACSASLFTARNVGAFDYDGDGLLDLFVVEDRLRSGGKARSALFRNLGNGKFEDVTRKVGLPEDIYGLGLAVADLNGDGRPDFFVPHSNRLFLSQKDGTYREAVELKETFAWKPLDNEDWPCGAAFADLNNDGLLDLVVSIHHKTARNRVYLNEGLKDGIPHFRDVTSEVGLGDPVPVRCPHVEVQDFDNDGRPDIYVSAAWLEDGKVTPLIYRNLGVKDGLPRFAPPRPIKAPMVYYPAGPSGDYDNDGRLDLFLINWFQENHCRLLHNDSPKRHWLQVRVAGKTINRMGLGSQVRLYKAGKSGQAEALLGFQEITIGFGYASGQPAIAHFGLGDEKAVDMEVKLPNGKVVKKAKVAADQRLVVEEP